MVDTIDRLTKIKIRRIIFTLGRMLYTFSGRLNCFSWLTAYDSNFPGLTLSFARIKLVVVDKKLCISFLKTRSMINFQIKLNYSHW